MKKLLLLTLVCLGMYTMLRAQNREQIGIVKVDSMPAVQASGPHFTGDVRANYKIPGGHPANISGGIITFNPGGRTVWHSHPKGQRIIILQDVGWVQQWEGAKVEVRPGDVIWIPPDVKHWHGATANTGMSYYAYVEIDNGKIVENMEAVTDSQYYN